MRGVFAKIFEVPIWHFKFSLWTMLRSQIVTAWKNYMQYQSDTVVLEVTICNLKKLSMEIAP